jgi:hypothetical protein
MPITISEAKTDLFKDLIRQHNIIMRNISRSIGFLQQGDFDLGLKDFLKSVVLDVDAHHYMEEVVVFPYAKNKQINIDILLSEHHKLEEVLKIILQKLEDINTLADLQKESLSLVSSLEELSKFLIPHLETEEDIIGDDFYSNILSKKEAKNLHSDILAHVRKETIPQLAYFLFSQTDEEVKHTAKSIPPFIIFVLKNFVLKINIGKYRSQIPYFYKYS